MLQVGLPWTNEQHQEQISCMYRQAQRIVECYAFLYRLHHKAWSFEVDVRTFVEPW